MIDLPVEEAIARVHKHEWSRVVASVARRFGDLDLAEESTADAFAKAVERWRRDGIPPNPGGWLTTTANRRAIDRLRREARRLTKHHDAQMISHDPLQLPRSVVEDDRLRLIFTCCHPALSLEAQVALTLRLICGLTVAEIASGFLVRETTMAQRLTRAKAKIKAARIPYRIPERCDLPERLSAVLTVIYLVFNEGYLTSSGQSPLRDDLTDEAIRLARLLRELLPDEPEVAGLLALMILTDSRRAARFSAAGELLTLSSQDRTRWNHQLVEEGHAIVRALVRAADAGGSSPGRYQLLAAINAVHTAARSVDDTDWPGILSLYNKLIRLDPSPIVRLNRAVAVAEVSGPLQALAEVDQLEDSLSEYHAFHVTRADLLTRLSRPDEAIVAYDHALQLTDNAAERALLIRMRDGSLHQAN